MNLLALPDAILDHIFRSLRGFQRILAARSCQQLKAIHEQCMWRSIKCSMARLTYRGRYCEVPHWTADVALLASLLRRSMLSQLRTLRLHIDAPCFEATRAPWIAELPSDMHCSLRKLVITVARHNYARPSALAITRILRMFPNLETIAMCGIKNVGGQALRNMFAAKRPVQNVELIDCTFCSASSLALTMLFTGNKPWPEHLRTLCVWSETLYSIVRCCRHMSPFLTLPSKLETLNVTMHNNPFSDQQLLTTLLRCASLRTVVAPRGVSVCVEYCKAMYPKELSQHRAHCNA